MKVKNINKILVLQQRQLGDVVVSTPIFSDLRKHYPKAHIVLFTEEKCFPLVQFDPNLDSFHILKKNYFSDTFKLYWEIFRGSYDLVVAMQQLPRCQMATLFSMAKWRLSFYPRHKYRKLLYNLYIDERSLNGYVCDIRSQILKPLGIEPSFEKPCLYLQEFEKSEARELLNSHGISSKQKFITLDATHKHERNRWPHYKELTKLILDNYPDFYIFLLRAPGEEEQLQEILNLDQKRIIMPTKAPNLRQSMALVSHASFHIGNSSAPVHIATGFNIPALVILAREDKQWYSPPKLQYQGRARQVEVRLEQGIYEKYLEELEIKNQNKLEKIEPDPHARLNLITPNKVLKVFDDLLTQPYY